MPVLLANEPKFGGGGMLIGNLGGEELGRTDLLGWAKAYQPADAKNSVATIKVIREFNFIIRLLCHQIQFTPTQKKKNRRPCPADGSES